MKNKKLVINENGFYLNDEPALDTIVPPEEKLVVSVVG